MARRMMKMRKTYSELIQLPTIQERFDYLNQGNVVGDETFGYDRYLNQKFYNTPEWKKVRRNVIARDEGCDMAHPDYPIGGRVIVHHLNAVTPRMILDRDPALFDMDNLVCVSHETHEAITYGSKEMLPEDPIERSPNDTTPWR